MRDYRKVARFLDGLIKDPNARFFYDLFADALVWSDEIPPADFPGRESFSASDLRGVWRYRTTIIAAQPDEKYQPAWEEGMRCFPNWPGFDPSRRDAALAATFLAMQQDAMQKWEDAEDRIEAELARKNVKELTS